MVLCWHHVDFLAGITALSVQWETQQKCDKKLAEESDLTQGHRSAHLPLRTSVQEQNFVFSISK